jgi:hypothetical protein
MSKSEHTYAVNLAVEGGAKPRKWGSKRRE